MPYKKIDVKSFGDHWSNRLEVTEQLQLINDNDTVIFCCWEGMSIRACGLLSAVVEWQARTGHAVDKIQFHSINKKELLPFKNICNQSNAVWGRGNLVWWKTPVKFVQEPNYLFGLFVGRPTVARNIIFYQCYEQYRSYFLFSRLKQDATVDIWNDPTDTVKHWVSDDSAQQAQIWWQTQSVESIDQAHFQDQYAQEQNTVAINLLNFYDQFSVELILETMTQGETFFPTEKTTRPLAGAKPFLIYASKYYLKYLRDLGFWTFCDIWDESYDQFEGPERWQRMKNVVQYIIKNPEVIKHACEIAKHNRQLLLTKNIYKDPNA